MWHAGTRQVQRWWAMIMHLEILPNFLTVVAAFAKRGALHEVARYARSCRYRIGSPCCWIIAMLSTRSIPQFGHLHSRVAIRLDLTMCDFFTSLMVGGWVGVIVWWERLKCSSKRQRARLIDVGTPSLRVM